ncbi:MAG: hypothetical protein NVSMB51_00940 [Solirubrobacteraceae bacterium]
MVADRGRAWLVTVVAAALTIYLGLQSGGFFPDATAVAAVVLAALLILRILVAAEPFAGLGRRALVGVGALALFALWTIISSAWSHSPSRATLEFDRVLLYLLALLLSATFVRTEALLRGLARGTALAGVAICGVALATRTLPQSFPIAPQLVPERLGYPLTYWNALGVLAVTAMLICLGLSASSEEPRPVRVLSSASLPLLAATLLFTLSRGAMAAGLVGLVVLLALVARRLMLSSLLAGVPASVIAVVVAYRADALTNHPLSAPALTQGRHVAMVVGGCCAGALLLRLIALLWEERLTPAPSPRTRRGRRRIVIGAAALAGVLLVAGLALGAPTRISTEFRRFTQAPSASSSADSRTRLLDPSNNGRIEHWRVAADAWQAQPLRGQGAGTYQVLWARNRRINSAVVNAHSLYLETLSDLGLVGLGLLAGALLALLSGLARLIRRADRPIAVAVFAAAVAWVLEAGIDWAWQMPAVTLWLFALGGLGLATREGDRVSGGPRRTVRIVLALGVLVLAVTPVRVGLSQLRLNQSLAAFRRDDCPTAISRALAANSALDARPEPFELLAYCDARAGQTGLAEAVIGNAIARDPANWEFHYDLALVRAAGSRDPRPEAARALTLNPLEHAVRNLAADTRTSDPRRWQQVARAAPLLIP